MCYSGLGHTLVSRILIPNKILTILQSYNLRSSHIYDLPSCVNSKVRLFADDCLLYRKLKNNQDQIDMQRDLDALMDWGSTWGMKFNAKKCIIMRVSRSRKPLQHFYSLGNEILQEVSDVKYLGIQIDNKLWNKHISTVAASGQSKLAFLNRNLKGCPKKLRDMAYISLIRPALEYSCSVWHPHKKRNKDKIKFQSSAQSSSICFEQF